MQESFIHDATIRQFLALSSRYFLDGRASLGEAPRRHEAAAMANGSDKSVTSNTGLEAAELLLLKPHQ